MRWPPPNSSFTTGARHPSRDTFPPTPPAARSFVLCVKASPRRNHFIWSKKSALGPRNRRRCQVFPSLFPRGITHRAVVDQRGPCARTRLSVYVFHSEGWQQPCVWACLCKPRPQLTRILCLFTQKGKNFLWPL